MFTNLINKILGAEQKISVSNRLEYAEPSVIVKKDSNKTPCKPIPEKYKKDLDALRNKYGDTFKTGLCISLTLQEALIIMPRERHRTAAYSGLVSYLAREWGITLTIKSNKTKSKQL